MRQKAGIKKGPKKGPFLLVNCRVKMQYHSTKKRKMFPTFISHIVSHITTYYSTKYDKLNVFFLL